MAANAIGLWKWAVMAVIAEKVDGTVVVLVHLIIKPGRDDPLIQMVRSAPRGSLAAFIREAMRSGIKVNERDTYQVSEASFDLPDIEIDL